MKYKNIQDENSQRLAATKKITIMPAFPPVLFAGTLDQFYGLIEN